MKGPNCTKDDSVAMLAVGDDLKLKSNFYRDLKRASQGGILLVMAKEALALASDCKSTSIDTAPVNLVSDNLSGYEDIHFLSPRSFHFFATSDALCCI
jgi:hypothetical protein